MAETSSGHLRLWEGSRPALPLPLGVAGPEPTRTTPLWIDHAHELALREILRGSSKPGDLAEPYTLQWFLDIENARHGRQGRWIPEVLEFTRHAGETLLGLGYGLGTDWVQYARNGAVVVVCCPGQEQLSLIRRNFDLRGLPGTFLHAGPANLPLDSGSIDVACVNGLLHEVPDPEQTAEELYRVLKPGGKVLLLLPARYDVEFWCRCIPWYGRKRSEDVSLPPGGPWPPPPFPRRFSARSVRQLFARFTEHRIHKRHLRRSDLPHLWRWCPLPLLERLMGRLLVLKAFKPLRATSVEQAAA